MAKLIKCEYCRKEFIPAKPSRRFCSKTCSNRGQPRGQAIKRYFTTFYERNANTIKEKLRRKYREDEEYRTKVLTRVKAHEHGNVEKQPCEVCGNSKADKHYDDYSKPFEYKWLCRSCHVKYHALQYGSWGEGLKV